MKKVITAVALCRITGALSPPAIPQASSFSSLSIRGGDLSNNSTAADTANSSGGSASTTLKKKKKKSKPKTVSTEEPRQEGRAPAKDTQDKQEAPTVPRPPKPDPLIEQLLKEEDYFTILGVSKTATEAQIKKGYRRRAVQTHPDKTGGDRRAFDKVSEAYDVLSDDSKRQLYVRYGKRGLDAGGGGTGGMAGASSAEELFRQFFGQNTQRRRRNRTVRYQLEVSLEDLYQGLTRPILVEQPHGRKKVQVHIPKGMSSGEAVTLSGEMDSVPDEIPGDLIFILQQRPHPTFTRKAHDLCMDLSITLQEAVCGVEREVAHLDGRKFVIQSARQLEDTPIWIQSGDVHVLKGEGMPKQDHVSEFGDLYVRFNVEMPKAGSADRLTVEERKQLGELLGKLEGSKGRPKHKETNPTIHAMEKASLSDFGRKSGPFQPQYYEQEERQQQQHQHQSFHWSSAGGFGGSHPFFGGMPTGNDDGSNVECQQM